MAKYLSGSFGGFLRLLRVFHNLQTKIDGIKAEEKGNFDKIQSELKAEFERNKRATLDYLDAQIAYNVRIIQETEEQMKKIDPLLSQLKEKLLLEKPLHKKENIELLIQAAERE